jgi:xylulokinase
MNMEVNTVRAGYANMFLSPLFARAFATVSDTTVELYSTDGAEGAARGAGIGAGVFAGRSDAFRGLERRETIEPVGEDREAYREAYARWLDTLHAAVPGTQTDGR